jgi:phosphoenolpyruvate synthase/pyruvate phosphate dikinase
MQFIKPFSDIDSQTLSAGAKGASLGEMTAAGIPIPAGFVVLTDAYKMFLTTEGLNTFIGNTLSTIEYEKLVSVEKAATAIQEKIHTIAIPKAILDELYSPFEQLGTTYVAVRSSATAEDGKDTSWAGELSSYLNTDRVNLPTNLRACWASLFSSRALLYAHKNKINPTTVAVAVVVQKMIDSEVAGVAFSVHPVSNNPDELVIEAGWGLGEAVVSGAITPNNYVVNKKDYAIKQKYIISQEEKLVRGPQGGIIWVAVSNGDSEIQNLSEENITKLARLIAKIEKHYGFPCDIEWALQDDQISILQSRPITTLTP